MSHAGAQEVRDITRDLRDITNPKKRDSVQKRSKVKKPNPAYVESGTCCSSMVMSLPPKKRVVTSAVMLGICECDVITGRSKLV